MASIRFSVIGLNHGHIYGQVNTLLRAGAELVSFFAVEPDLSAAFSEKYPQAHQARNVQEVLQDDTIQLIASAAVPNERASLGIEAMRHGKDFFSDKPAFVSLEDLEKARRAQAETGRIFSIFYGERLENKATVRAGELVKEGAIGRVVQTLGLGPHRANLPSRPAWFFERVRYGGIITDIGSHQCDQYLFFTGETEVEIASSQVANWAHPEHPELEDFGDVTLRGRNSTGYIRVDWFTPGGLSSWGDGRLIVLGTEGYIELRKGVDIAGRSGGNHLFLVNGEETKYIDCSAVELPFGKQLVHDIQHRTQTAMSQEHAFRASEVALRAQAQAVRLGHLK